MKSYRPALFATLSLVAAATAAAGQAARPDPEVVATVQAAMEAARKADMAGLARQYASDVTFVDEFAPFFWSGPNAMASYFASGARMYQETQHLHDRFTAGPPAFVYVAGDRAFVVEPVRGSASVGGKPYASKGAYALTLARVDGAWKITSQTWTKASESRNPYQTLSRRKGSASSRS